MTKDRKEPGQEKTKRVPKPVKSQAIIHLLAAVPFLNSPDDPKTLCQLAEQATMSPKGMPSRFPDGDGSIVSHLKETRDLCREMLFVAILQDDYRERLQGLPEREARQIQEPEEAKIKERNARIEEAINKGKRVVYWRHKANTTSQQKPLITDDSKKKTPMEHAVIFRAGLCMAIIESFDSGNGKPGGLYVGMCPRCKAVFVKNRGDQEYCSVLCRDAERQMRYYLRK